MEYLIMESEEIRQIKAAAYKKYQEEQSEIESYFDLYDDLIQPSGFINWNEYHTDYEWKFSILEDMLKSFEKQEEFEKCIHVSNWMKNLY